jgi:actin-related protein 3
MSKSFFN